MSNIDQTISFLQQFSDKALGHGRDLARSIQGYSSGGSRSVGFNHTLNPLNLGRPPAIGDLLNEYEKQDINVLMLNDVAEKWIEKWFPNIASCMSYQPEEWACGILSGEKPFGLNREHFEAVWHEGRDRAYRQAGTDKAQVLAEYSLRGFAQPPGAAIKAMRSAEVRASDAIADINRAQTIKDAEITLELIKFAADTASTLKAGMMSMLASLFGNIVKLANHDPGSDKMRAKAQAYSAFMNAMSSYYRVELGFEELRLNASKAKADVDLANSKVEVDATAARNNARYQALGVAARGFAEAAGSAANAQSSLQAELYSGQIE